MFKNILNYKGRIRRLEYGISYLIYLLIAYSDIFFIQFYDQSIPDVIFYSLWITAAVLIIIQGAKRCHDRGNSGWYQLIPFYQLWMLFGDGEEGQNEYGSNPKGIGNDKDEIDEIGKNIVD